MINVRLRSAVVSGTGAVFALHGVELPAQSLAQRVSLSAPNTTFAAEFTRVASIRELADGSTLVVDGGDNSVQLVNWARRTVTPVGKNGAGPGEYANPGSIIALAGDSSLIPDPRNGRWLLLKAGRIVRTSATEDAAFAAGARTPLGADAAGRIYFTRALPGARGPESVDSVVLLRTTRTSGHVDTLARLRARASRINMTGTTGRQAIEVTMNPLSTGEMAVVFADGSVAIARLDPYRIEWIAPDGRVVRGRSIPVAKVVVDDAEQQRAVERERAQRGGQVRTPDSFPDWPPVLPPFLTGFALAAPDRSVWIRRLEPVSTRSQSYDIVSRTGDAAARLELPVNEHVVGFGAHAVYTVRTDDDGLQRLRRHPTRAW